MSVQAATPTKPRPSRSTVNVLAIPEELKGRPQWAAFRYGLRDGAWTKMPKQPNGKNAKTDDPATWSSFDAALAAYEEDRTLDGIGYIFAEDDPYCGIDIDKLRSDPERMAWALGIIERLGTYAEWSVSGNGLHAIGKGRMPDADGTPQKGRNDHQKGLEAYSRRRFFTFTGQLVDASPAAIVNVQPALDWLLANEFKPKDASKPTIRVERSGGPIATTDRMERIKERMIAGPRGAQLRRLYDGDASDYHKADGSSDYSSADLSLCSGLWYYADGDAATVESMWLGSGLASARPNGQKLDRADYRQSTLTQAAGGKTYRDTHGYSAWEDPPQFKPKPRPSGHVSIGHDGGATCPDDEPATLADALALVAHLRQENAELRESNRDLLGWVDRTAGFVEDLQAANATLSRKLTQELAHRAEDRRLAAAERALGQVKTLTTNQKAAIRSFARIAASKASRGETEAVISRGEVAEDMGAHEATAGAALKSVFQLDGVPIRRWNEWVNRNDENGTPLQMKITKYNVAGWEKPADIIEAMAEIGNAQAERVKRYNEPRRCPEHPDAKVITQLVCDECGYVLPEDERAAPTIRMTHSHRELTPPPVDELVPRTSDSLLSGADAPGERERVARIANDAPVSLLDYAASVEARREPAPPKCSCGCMEYARRADGWRCLKCRTVYDPPLLTVAGGAE